MSETPWLDPGGSWTPPEPDTTQAMDEIDARLQRSLQESEFAASTLWKIAAGPSNRVYHAQLAQSLDDGTDEVVVKFSGRCIAAKQDYDMYLGRSQTEAVCLESQEGLPIPVVDSLDEHSAYRYAVRTPRFYLHNTKVEGVVSTFQEHLPNSIDLKSYILRQYAPDTPAHYDLQCRELGRAVGRWRVSFGKWAIRRPELRAAAAENKSAKEARPMLRFAALGERVREFIHILDDAVEILKQVQHMAAIDSHEDSKLEVVHGDFHAGNIRIPDQTIKPNVPISLFVVNWEMAQLNIPYVDSASMIAELWAIWLSRNITAALWVLEGFVDSLGEMHDEMAFRTALQVGVHLLYITAMQPEWREKGQVEELVRVARDVIVKAWRRDREWFLDGGLRCLFRR